METKELTALIQAPEQISPAQTAALRDLLEEFPYFQAARAVRLKGLKNQNSLHYNKELKITAAYTLDREMLFDFITSEKFLQNQISEQIKNLERSEDQKGKDAEGTENETSKGTKKNTSLDEVLRMQVRDAEKILDPDLFLRSGGAEKKPEEDQAKDQLDLGAPLPFQRNENHSFSEWLKLTKATPIVRKEEEEETGSRMKKFELIDEFIAKNPKINPARAGKKANLAEKTLTGPEALMTETLARVYLEQKNYKKAIQAYKILILKNPEKSGFFADQIRAIEKLQEHNS